MRIGLLLIVFGTSVLASLDSAAQTMMFGRVKLGEDSSYSIQLIGSQDDALTSATVEVFGDAFEGPGSVNFWTYGNKTPQATLSIKFTPQHPGWHHGSAIVHKSSGPFTIVLGGNGDSLIPDGVFAHPKPQYLESVYYPPSVYPSGDTSNFKVSILVKNHSFSSDTLTLDIPKPNRFSIPDSQYIYRIAPDSTAQIWFVLDSNNPGDASQFIQIPTNAANLPVTEYYLRGAVDNFPRLRTIPKIDTFRTVHDIRSVTFDNTGGRTLTVDLPELRAPFFWRESSRHFELSTSDYLWAEVGVLNTQDSTAVHEYWVRTNSRISDSSRFMLISDPEQLEVGIPRLDVLSLIVQGDRAMISSVEAARLAIYDLAGRPIVHTMIEANRELIVEALRSGTYFLSIRTDRQHLLRKFNIVE